MSAVADDIDDAPIVQRIIPARSAKRAESDAPRSIFDLGRRAKPKRSAISTIDDIRERCVADSETGCWQWAGATSKGNPCARLPGRKSSTTIGAAIHFALHGAMPPSGRYMHVVCGNKRCANPAHRRLGNRRDQMMAASLERTPQQRAKISAKKARLGDADIAQIQAAVGIPVRELAERFRIHPTYVSEIRNGTARRFKRRRALEAVMPWAGVPDWIAEQC